MTDDRLSASVRQLVAERAGQRCEYCLLTVGVAFFAHEVDHVVARKHGGRSDPANLALACWRCNRHKGSDVATLDRTTGALVRLYDPRTQAWTAHFRLEGALIIGFTPTGNATVQLLQLNTEARIAERGRLLVANAFPAPPQADG